MHDGREQLDARRYRRRKNSQRFDSTNRHAFSQRFDIGRVAWLGRQKRWEDALAAFEAADGPPSAVLRSCIVDALAKSMQLELAQQKFNEMPEKSVPAYNSLITLLGRLGRLEDVEALVDDMRQDSLELNAVTYGSIITAHARVGDGQAARQAFEQMIGAGIAPNAVSFAAVLSACARAGDHVRAAELLAKMKSWDIQPNIGHFTSVITSFARAGAEVRALEVFREMRHQCIKPDVVAYTSLIGCFAGEDALPQAEAVLAEMQEDGLSPNAFTYSAMLLAAIRSNSAQRFQELLTEMDERGIPRTAKVELRVRQMQEALDQHREVPLRADEDADPSFKSDVQGTAAAASVPQVSSPLPPGWQGVLDPQTGRYYYWMESNPAGTVTWNRPA